MALTKGESVMTNSWRRLRALTLVCCLPFWMGLLFWYGIMPKSANAAGEVIINEWSQGSAGSEEWVELLVVEGTVDLRQWDLGDSTPGDLQFAPVPFWQAVPAGSLIVLYNNTADIPLVPDLDWSDGIIIVPDDESTLLNGNWPALSNSNDQDNPHLRNELGQTVHNFSQEPGVTLHPGAQQAVAFTADSLSVIGDEESWLIIAATESTPGMGNSVSNTAWIDSLRGSLPPTPDTADVFVQKTAPATIPFTVTTAVLTYQLTIGNLGQTTATAVMVTDTLPTGLTYLADSSGQTPQIIENDQLVWQWATVAPSVTHAFVLTTTVAPSWTASLNNLIVASTTMTDTNLTNNEATAVTRIVDPRQPPILIEAMLADGWANGDKDEAIALWNMGQTPVDIGGWQLRNGTNRVRITLPSGLMLAPATPLWVAKEDLAFRTQFGHWPDVAFIASEATVLTGEGSWQNLSNSGGSVTLYDDENRAIDTLLYGTTSETPLGWTGTAVLPFKVGNVGLAGQLLYRQRDQHTGWPVPDSDTALDWAQSLDDVVNGRKIRYPGWRLDEYFFTHRVTNTAVVTLGIAPDNAFELLLTEISQAQESLQIETHTFENLAIMTALEQAAERGVDVTILLEGSPPGGIADQQRYICHQIELAGGACWYMINDSSANIHNRYTYLHAKFMLIDGRKVVISSENLSPNSLPADDKSDGTWGRRGVLLVTDAPDLVTHVAELFAADFAPAVYQDLRRHHPDDDQYGPPPFGFVPITATGGTTYTVRYPEPVVATGSFAFELLQSPENSLRDVDGLLGLLAQAGSGDTIMVQQLSERPYWGATTSNAMDDPNIRLEAYLAAARRGATVWILLDSYFDSATKATSNQATCAYVTAVAKAERLGNLHCELANPTGLGIHSKMILVEANGRGYVHLGSLNGTEQSHKANRELAVQVQSDVLYEELRKLFLGDWPFVTYMPLMMNQYIPPARYVLISELVYDPPGMDEAEFVELYNPTGMPVDLSYASLSDASIPDVYADLRRFPAGTTIMPGQVLVVAQQAVPFEEIYGRVPDFELLDSSPVVPNLFDDPHWGDTSTYLQLSNTGDVIFFRNAADEEIDRVAYGDVSVLFGSICPAVETSYSLRRQPYWRDTDNCPLDFEAWPAPTPGEVP
jgi:cardiolipin synthase